jgi:predicted negative regulator of RcsB-dependent stress response
MEYDEHEQSERVRGWLRQNGSSLVTGILMGLLLVFGWQFWQKRGDQHKAEASGQYDTFITALEAKDAAKVKVLSGQLNEKFSDTGYATLAALRQVSFLHDSGKDAEALALLRSTRAKAKDPDFVEIIDVRIARLLLMMGKPGDASKELAKIANPKYPQLTDELRGDIAAAQGKRDEARKAYEQALSRLDEGAATRQLLELKLIDAGGNPPAAKPET